MWAQPFGIFGAWAVVGKYRIYPKGKLYILSLKFKNCIVFKKIWNIKSFLICWAKIETHTIKNQQK
ncbi:MAG: hypothetical protein EAZ15_05590 [Sphingobacteriales bacterium]|nr:MAG: hypothetical protein EAZ15_05590 [Sphingobacteriales bacterium]